MQSYGRRRFRSLGFEDRFGPSQTSGTAAILSIGDACAIGGFAEAYLGHERAWEGLSLLYVRFIFPKRVVLHRGVRRMNILDHRCRSVGRGRAFPLRLVQR
jgi:hypothetical protein